MNRMACLFFTATVIGCSASDNPLGSGGSDNAFDPGNVASIDCSLFTNSIECPELNASWAPEWDSLLFYQRFNGSGTVSHGEYLPGFVGGGGNHVDGGGGPISYVTGQVRNAISLDGVNDWVVLENATILNNHTELSMCAWIYLNPASVTTDYAIVSKFRSGAGHLTGGVLFWVDDVAQLSGRTDTVAFTVTGASLASGRVEGSTGLATTRQWDHYCGTFKGSTFIRLYKNGVLDREATAGIVANSYSFTDDYPDFAIGSTGNVPQAPALAPGKFMYGKIDEVAIWNRALSATQVALIYDRQKVQYSIPGKD